MVPGRTVAVDPKIFPYGTKFRLPDFEKELVAEDTGSDVLKKTASKKRAESLRRSGAVSDEEARRLAAAPVIDIAVKDFEQYKKLINTYPSFVYARVTYPRERFQTPNKSNIFLARK